MLITPAIVAAIVLLHIAYVDFRFRYREGVVWFWRLSPAPPLMWIARLLIVAAVILGLCVRLIGTNTTFIVALASLMVLHIISLILLEVLEPR
jgi:hypothetical protein